MNREYETDQDMMDDQAEETPEQEDARADEVYDKWLDSREDW